MKHQRITFIWERIDQVIVAAPESVAADIYEDLRVAGVYVDIVDVCADTPTESVSSPALVIKFKKERDNYNVWNNIRVQYGLKDFETLNYDGVGKRYRNNQVVGRFRLTPFIGEYKLVKEERRLLFYGNKIYQYEEV